MKSIANRIYRAIFIVSITSILIIIVTVQVVNENLETTMLHVVPDDDSGLVLQARQQAELFIWNGATNKIAFIPAGATIPANMPEIFTHIGKQTTAELVINGETYLVNVQHTEEGSLYWARNITAFELRESRLMWSVYLIAAIMALLSLVLAIVSSRKIVQPLQSLSRQIGRLPVGKQMPAIDQAYRDQELHDIALTFNRFLGELNAYVEREQHLLNLASHELRTPIAVVAGALDVIESRRQLQVNDAVTLARIRKANDDMAANVHILLRLSRNQLHQEETAVIVVADCVRSILADLDESYRIDDRVSVEEIEAVRVSAPPAMIRMLLQNLIQNALQHTSGRINIVIAAGEIVISDYGQGRIRVPAASLLEEESADSRAAWGSGGLGLYIVTLICERLGWVLDVKGRDGMGNSVSIGYGRDVVVHQDSVDDQVV